ncbi:hypothetical protein [Streptomyces ficellus]|uniref:Secreted protein n=1 Tax=Streptomyces ficellus TaxID=1977088 RepID=A0A6I6FJH6_9ACTN|nr:hypothetical protein [Streptomyces ficellus]QGV79325.1 hypothetical protein EIZ62_14455 [Streptomyces ficellus]
MRLLTPRRVAATALCAALTLGTAGTALAHSAPHAGPQRAEAPQDIGEILGAVGDILDAALGTASGAASSGTNSAQTLPAAEMDQQMKDLAAAIEALRKAAAETETNTAGTATATTTVPRDGTDTVDLADLGMDAGTGMDAGMDMDKALADMDKSIDALVEAAANGQAGTSATQVQAASKALMDAIMRDVAQMTGTPAAGIPATGTNTLPATSQPATTLPATSQPATTLPATGH